MVTTRRKHAAAPDSSITTADSIDAPNTRAKRAVRKAAPPATHLESQSPTAITTTTATANTTITSDSTVATATRSSRRTRANKTTDSPLKELTVAQAKRNAPKKKITQNSKRARDTPHYHINNASASVTPEPESVRSESVVAESVQDENDDDQGIFFTQSFDDLPTTHNADASSAQSEFVRGTDSALALLHRIENSARENRVVESETQQTADITPPSSSQSSSKKRKSIDAGRTNTTPRATSSGGFLSRSISALKSKFGFSSPAPAPASEPAPPTHAPSNAPPADTLTEALSGPPTPVGERSNVRPKKPKQSPMLRLLLKGVETSDLAKAEKWAKNAIPELMNYDDFAEKRKRLETPVLVQNLETLPSSKPWEGGFGDPLGDLDDEDVAPVWAVYCQIILDEEKHKAKKHKSCHAVSMDVEDTLSLNDMYASTQDSPVASKLHNSNGHSASLEDLRPRRAVEPSPMFDSPVSHQKGKNIFRERQGHEETAQLRADDRESLQQATKKVTKEVTQKDVPKHNPAEGSYGLDYDSDEDDSTVISETSNAEASTTETADPVWTQAPPPAPVPAHAPLPGASATESAAAAPATEKPVDEVERQRQKLMKHTPAKPSRLREAFVPSPSLISDAGNESILMTTPLAASVAAAETDMEDIFADMPEPEDLGLDEDIMKGVEEMRNDPEWQATLAANQWPDIIYTYDSDEEELSAE